MKSLLVLSLLFSAGAFADSTQSVNQENFSQVFARLGNTRWVGSFTVKSTVGFTGLVGVNCGGPIAVKFYNDQSKVFPDQSPTISYRHHADFSADVNPLCRIVGPHLSEVDVGKCKTFPERFDQDENQWVPFRTLVAKEGGASAVVNSPSCDKGQVARQELQLARLDLEDQDPSKPKTLKVTIILSVDIGEVLPLKAELNYTLMPDPNPTFSGPWTDMIELNHQL